MPFIHIMAYKGRDKETQIKAAEAIVAAAAETLGAAEELFTVVYEDLEPSDWQEKVTKAELDPRRDMVIYAGGKPVV